MADIKYDPLAHAYFSAGGDGESGPASFVRKLEDRLRLEIATLGQSLPPTPAGREVLQEMAGNLTARACFQAGVLALGGWTSITGPEWEQLQQTIQQQLPSIAHAYGPESPADQSGPVGRVYQQLDQGANPPVTSADDTVPLSPAPPTPSSQEEVLPGDSAECMARYGLVQERSREILEDALKMTRIMDQRQLTEICALARLLRDHLDFGDEAQCVQQALGYGSVDGVRATGQYDPALGGIPDPATGLATLLLQQVEECYPDLAVARFADPPDARWVTTNGHHIKISGTGKDCVIVGGHMDGIKFNLAADLLKAGYAPSQVRDLHAANANMHKALGLAKEGRHHHNSKDYKQLLERYRSASAAVNKFSDFVTKSKELASSVMASLFGKKIPEGGTGAATGAMRSWYSSLTKLPGAALKLLLHKADESLSQKLPVVTQNKTSLMQKVWMKVRRDYKTMIADAFGAQRKFKPSIFRSLWNISGKFLYPKLTARLQSKMVLAELALNQKYGEKGARTIRGIVNRAVTTASLAVGTGVAIGTIATGGLGIFAGSVVGYLAKRGLANCPYLKLGLAGLVGKMGAVGVKAGKAVGRATKSAATKVAGAAKRVRQTLRDRRQRIRERKAAKTMPMPQSTQPDFAFDPLLFEVLDEHVHFQDDNPDAGGLQPQEYIQAAFEYLGPFLKNLETAIHSHHDEAYMKKPLTDEQVDGMAREMEEPARFELFDDMEMVDLLDPVVIPDLVLLPDSGMLTTRDRVQAHFCTHEEASDDQIVMALDRLEEQHPVGMALVEGWPCTFNAQGLIEKSSVGWILSDMGRALGAHGKVGTLPESVDVSGEEDVLFDTEDWSPYEGKRGQRAGMPGMKHRTGWVVWQGDPRYEKLMQDSTRGGQKDPDKLGAAIADNPAQDTPLVTKPQATGANSDAVKLVEEDPRPAPSQTPQVAQKAPAQTPEGVAQRIQLAYVGKPGSRGGPNSALRNAIWDAFTFARGRQQAWLGGKMPTTHDSTDVDAVWMIAHKRIPNLTGKEFFKELQSVHTQNQGGGPDGVMQVHDLAMSAGDLFKGRMSWTRPGDKVEFAMTPEEKIFFEQRDAELAALFARNQEGRRQTLSALQTPMEQLRQHFQDQGNSTALHTLQQLTQFCQDAHAELARELGPVGDLAVFGTAFLDDQFDLPVWLDSIPCHEALVRLPVLACLNHAETPLTLPPAAYFSLTCEQLQEMGRLARARVMGRLLGRVSILNVKLRAIMANAPAQTFGQGAVTFNSNPGTYQDVPLETDHGRLLADIVSEGDRLASRVLAQCESMPEDVYEKARGSTMALFGELSHHHGLAEAAAMIACGLKAHDGAKDPPMLCLAMLLRNVREKIPVQFDSLAISVLDDLGRRSVGRLLLEWRGQDIGLQYRDLDCLFTDVPRDGYGQYLPHLHSPEAAHPLASEFAKKTARGNAGQQFTLYQEQPGVSSLTWPALKPGMDQLPLPAEDPASWLANLDQQPLIQAALDRWANPLIRTTKQLYAVQRPRSSVQTAKLTFAAACVSWLNACEAEDAPMQQRLMDARHRLDQYVTAPGDGLLPALLQGMPFLRTYADKLVDDQGRPILAGKIAPLTDATGKLTTDERGNVQLQRTLTPDAGLIQDVFYLPQRQALHQKIVQANLNPAAVSTPPTGLIIWSDNGFQSQLPVLAGKVLNRQAGQFTSVNPYALLEALPEWLGWNACHLLEEAMAIAYGMLLPSAMMAGHTLVIVLPMQRVGGEIIKLPNQLQRFGYQAIAVHAQQSLPCLVADILGAFVKSVQPDQPQTAAFWPPAALLNPVLVRDMTPFDQSWSMDNGQCNPLSPLS